MIQAFNDYISQHNLAQKDNKILLAVSGGIDSLVMTDLFYKSGFKNIAIAHCNFSLRGEESDGDEKHVRQFALEHDIPIFVIRFHTKEYAKMHKVSTQVAARELRYAWFKRLRAEHGFDFIAIAHNMNDNMETVLLNLTRGSGLTGLTGIKAKNEYIIRPLLFATRQMIEEYSKENDITYREDSSNSENKYNRNKIR
ncbi:MAG: tRNA lysidine(34) synthetase TilS, partial [Bacteroidales bacterium]|nr:tRNA lysidine(34) synthetase TilS [Bacteroidales bacterium]